MREAPLDAERRRLPARERDPTSPAPDSPSAASHALGPAPLETAAAVAAAKLSAGLIELTCSCLFGVAGALLDGIGLPRREWSGNGDGDAEGPRRACSGNPADGEVADDDAEAPVPTSE